MTLRFFEVVEVSPGEIQVCGYLAIDAPQHPTTNEALLKLLFESDRKRIGRELAIEFTSGVRFLMTKPLADLPPNPTFESEGGYPIWTVSSISKEIS
jgi:hypothetical protein